MDKSPCPISLPTDLAYLYIDTKSFFEITSLNYMFSYKGVLLFMIKKKLFLSTLILKMTMSSTVVLLEYTTLLCRRNYTKC